MKAIKPSVEFLEAPDGEKILRKIEKIARTCYKSESAVTDESSKRMVRNLIEHGHEAMIEHESVTVKFTIDRGISHEVVRHRPCSFAQESTRYCNYSKGKFSGEITCVIPPAMRVNPQAFDVWMRACRKAEEAYFELLDLGLKPEKARSVLPTSLKTELIMTANLREWRHFFKLRALGTTGKPHPQMKEVAFPLLKMFQETIPVVFDDLTI